jgi:hypothetical protein
VVVSFVRMRCGGYMHKNNVKGVVVYGSEFVAMKWVVC